MPLKTTPDTPLRQKFDVSRRDNTPLPSTAEFFVLRLDEDNEDSRNARVAVDFYARGMEESDPRLCAKIQTGLNRLDDGGSFYEVK